MTNIACVTQPGYTSGWLMKKRGATHGITLFFIIQGLKLWILWIASISKVIRMNSYSNDTLHYYYFWPIWVALVTATGAMRLPSYAWPCSTRPAKVTALWHPLRCDTRLQQFVARSFREQLGRQSGALHVNVRQYAAGWHKGTTGWTWKKWGKQL